MSFFLSLEKVRNERKYVCVQVTAGFKRHIYSFHLTFATDLTFVSLLSAVLKVQRTRATFGEVKVCYSNLD